MITLSLDAINQVSPYKVVMTDGDYDFVTSEGVRYSASFLEDIIVENCNPKLEAIINDFNHSAESLTTGKP